MSNLSTSTDNQSPGRKGAENISDPFAHGLVLAQSAARRVRNRRLQLRISFIESTGEAVPPLARFLRGGRGGEVRLKLYLSMLWVAANPPHDVTFPARSWAELVGLPEPEGSGDRRVRDAIDWLAANKFVSVTRTPGRPTTVYLRREDGSDEQYTLPATARKKEETKLAEEHWWVHLPAEFWTKGWLMDLSAAGTAILLVMLVLTRGREADDSFWISPREARRRFSLSEDTWTKGTRELDRLGLIAIGRKPVSRDFEWKRVRNTYVLTVANLKSDIPGRTSTA